MQISGLSPLSIKRLQTNSFKFGSLLEKKTNIIAAINEPIIRNNSLDRLIIFIFILFL